MVIKGNRMSDNMTYLPGCPGKMDVPSDKEKACLMELKAIKERVRELKAKSKYFEGLTENDAREGILKVEEELRNLKKRWNEWEEKRLHAEKERMIILGHEESEDN